MLLEVGWAAIIPTDAREYGVDLLGTEAGISLFPARLLRNVADGFETVQLHVRHTPFTENRVHHFVNCILDSKKPVVALEESLKTQQILDAIYLSAASGKEVRLK
jgi:predicted dehydrogenase